jgi:hypothetical protein
MYDVVYDLLVEFHELLVSKYGGSVENYMEIVYGV